MAALTPPGAIDLAKTPLRALHRELHAPTAETQDPEPAVARVPLAGTTWVPGT